jgi:hypothetical protein
VCEAASVWEAVSVCESASACEASSSYDTFWAAASSYKISSSQEPRQAPIFILTAFNSVVITVVPHSKWFRRRVCGACNYFMSGNIGGRGIGIIIAYLHGMTFLVSTILMKFPLFQKRKLPHYFAQPCLCVCYFLFCKRIKYCLKSIYYSIYRTQ